MVPLTMAYAVARHSDPVRAQDIARELYAHRLRLAHMASNEGRFGWWGPYMPVDPFLTGWAYYADWAAVQALGMQLPAEHWQALETVYSDGVGSMSLWQRALMIDWMRHMHLPVQTLVSGLLKDLQASKPVTQPDSHLGWRSLMLDADSGSEEHAMAWVLAGHMAGLSQVSLNPMQRKLLAAASIQLGAASDPQAQSLLVYAHQLTPDHAGHLLLSISPNYPTMDRALMLTWLVESLGGLNATPVNVALAAPWEKIRTLSGSVYFHLPPGQANPTQLQLSRTPAQHIAARVSYDSAEGTPSRPLAASFTRSLYRLVPLADGGFSRQAVTGNASVGTDELYLDEIHLQPAGSGKPLDHGLLQVALPPGAALETGTWGVNIKTDNNDTASALEAARAESTAYGYAVPVDKLREPLVIRHLLRFAQKGRFQLPSAYLYSMYDPDARAYEGGDQGVHTLTVH